MKGEVMHQYFIAYSITSRKGNGWGYEFGNSLLDLEKPISSMADVAIVEKKLEENSRPLFWIAVCKNKWHGSC